MWDGDTESLKFFYADEKKVLSPLCGMETYPAHFDKDMFVMVLSPLCGMETSVGTTFRAFLWEF